MKVKNFTEELKRIKYIGHTFYVKKIYKFISIDENGGIFIFSKKPILTSHEWRNRKAACDLIGSIDSYDNDWRESLKEI